MGMVLSILPVITHVILIFTILPERKQNKGRQSDLPRVTQLVAGKVVMQSSEGPDVARLFHSPTQLLVEPY